MAETILPSGKTFDLSRYSGGHSGYIVKAGMRAAGIDWEECQQLEEFPFLLKKLYCNEITPPEFIRRVKMALNGERAICDDSLPEKGKQPELLEPSEKPMALLSDRAT